MGLSHKSHDRKSDKETQSPKLRVFEEMIQNEHKDTEKANLLKEKQEKSNRKSYTKLRSKTDHKAPDTSSVDQSQHRSKRKTSERAQQNSNDWAYNENGTQSIPYQREKRDSWWLWKDAEKKGSDDTCSCATCPLKKLMGTDYACVGCLVIVFLISVLITAVVVFKTMPLTLGHGNEGDLQMNVKRHMVTVGSAETTSRAIWSPEFLNRFGSYSGLFGSGHDDSSFQDSKPNTKRHVESQTKPQSVIREYKRAMTYNEKHKNMCTSDRRSDCKGLDSGQYTSLVV